MNKIYYKTILVVLLFALGLLLRVYNFPNRINFGLEQGITLTTTAEYLNGHFSLLGLPAVQRTTSTGHQIFSAPIYNYFLMPFMLVFGYNPIILTYTALFINLITGAMLYLLNKKLSGQRVAIFAAFLYLFDMTMISQSLTIWILNPMPLIGLVSMYLIIKNHENITPKISLYLGLLSGLALGLEYMYLFTIILLTIYIVYRSKQRIFDFGIFILGLLISLAPTVIFDLRHDWYHMRTLWQYLLDVINNPGQSKLSIYHFYQYFPLAFYLGALVLDKIFKSSKMIAAVVMCIYLIFQFKTGEFSFTQAVGTAKFMNTPKMMQVAKAIADDNSTNFNVVYMSQAEHRAYSLRYILIYVFGVKPMEIDQYPSTKHLYVLAASDRDMSKDIPWEITSTNLSSRGIIYRTDDSRFVVYKYE